MTIPYTAQRRTLIAAAILLAGTLIVALAPAEQTLGQAVKVVYVHVALSRAGGIGLLVAGLLGLGVLLSGNARLAAWMQGAGDTALAFYAAGLVVSFLAQMLSWGGIAWREPRVTAALNGLAVGLIVAVGSRAIEQLVQPAWQRSRGVLYAALGGWIAWSQITAANVLHPAGSAISSSDSIPIRLGGVALLMLALLAGVWITWERVGQGQTEAGV